MSTALHIFQIVSLIVLAVLFVPAFLDMQCPVRDRRRPLPTRMLIGLREMLR
jgi:hypothetical protein